MAASVDIINQAMDGTRLSDEDALLLIDHQDLGSLLNAACVIRDAAHGSVLSYSPKVFIPLTRLCRDVCHYCTFVQSPKNTEPAFLAIEQMSDIARKGAKAGCHEALFTLGDKPELRYRVARDALRHLGHDTTLSYLAQAAKCVHEQTGLLPHLNPGVLDATDIVELRKVSASMGIMLESVSERLCRKGGPHYGSPDKHPSVRLETIRLAGEYAVPFTTGILIGIGETRRERIESLLAIRRLQEHYGHIQEVIVQNFRAKPNTLMSQMAEPSLEDHQWTIAVTRLILGAEMNVQAPPNLRPGELAKLIDAGINDWGGISPVTVDHVNPEAPWPKIEHLERAAKAAGKQLVPRLAIYPRYACDANRWLDHSLRTEVLRSIDSDGFVRDHDWAPGSDASVPKEQLNLIIHVPHPPVNPEFRSHLDRLMNAECPTESDIVNLFTARGEEFRAVCEAADRVRSEVNGDTVSYVVNRNINYTNVCYFRCRFCAFSKGKTSENLRGQPYDLDLEEIARRTQEAWDRGATEVCMQGGIHPDYTGQTYLEICRAVKTAAPDIHVHAFSPLEVWQGARTLGMAVSEYLRELKATGLASLPGTAAEILDNEVRAVICPDKLTTAQWSEVVESAHEAGIPTTSTIMFGHVDRPTHWARHLLRLRDLQQRTLGITEFVPLPFVHMEAPIYIKGQARRGPTFRETVLMHAVSRLVLHPYITNIQASWVKLGTQGALACLQAGANDLGGSLMNETISRAAGAAHGQELSPGRMEHLIRQIGRSPRQRSTLYQDVSEQRHQAAIDAEPLTAVVNRPAHRYAHANLATFES